MIIFGFGRRTTRRFGPYEGGACRSCGKSAYSELLKVTTWFTLFFIPVIPYRFEFLLACPVCGYAVKISKVDFEKLTEGRPALPRDISVLGEGPSVDDMKYAGKTPTQIAYLKSIEDRDKRKNSETDK